MASTDRTVLCTYRVKPRREKEFRALLRRHVPTLRRLGLVRDERPVVYRGEEDGGAPFYVEIFTWKTARAVERAHTLPEVAAIWEPMAQLCEERGGRPAMDFPHVSPVTLGRG